MQKLPIEYFAAKVLRYNDVLQWIEFRGGRHWLAMSEPSCSFSIGLASENFNIQSNKIQFRDKFGHLLETSKKTLTTPPEGFSRFDFLPPAQSALMNVEIVLGSDTHRPYPISMYMPLEGEEPQLIFTIRPELLYPDFLFEAVHNYGPALANTFANFVETGSLYGHTCIHASYYFETAHTIELSDHLYDCLKPIEATRPNLHVHKGNSKDILPKVVNTLSGPTVFFLDAHWSGDNSVDWTKGKFDGYPTETAHGGTGAIPSPEEQKPIETEFDLIFKQHSDPALLIIDDWDIMGESDAVFDKFDWSHISKGRLMQYFAASPRTVFHHRLGESRYVVGLKGINDI